MANSLLVKDVFFDLDHTLWDFDKNSKLAYKRVFKQFKIDVEFERFIKIYEPINLEYWKKYRYAFLRYYKRWRPGFFP